MTGLAAYWARTVLRRRRDVALLVVLVALGAGAATAAAAGARRTASADDRLLAQSNVPDAYLYAGDEATLAAALALPGVEVASGFQQLGLQPSSVPCGDGPEQYFPVFAPAAGEAFAVPRPRLVAGRFADPEAPGEVVVSEQHADRLGVGVGDRIELLPFLVDADRGEIEGCGEEVVAQVVVVGVIRELLEIGAAGEPTQATTWVTPALAEDLAELSLAPLFGWGGFVHLADGTSLAELDARLQRSLPDAAVFAFGGPSPLEPTIDALAVGLWGLAGALALATTVALVAAVARQVAAWTDDLRLVAAVGGDRASLTAAVVLASAVPVVVGALLVPVVATLLSPAALVGLARRVDPDPGIDVDPVAQALGALAVLVVGATAIGAAARSAASRALRPPTTRRGGRVTVADRLARTGAPPWTSIGVGYAFERSGRGRALPGRLAVAGVAAATAGILGVLVFGVGVGRANDDPFVYGWGDWDAFVTAESEEAQADPAVLEDLGGLADVVAVSRIQARFELTLDGEVVPGSPVEHLLGRAGPTVVDGRQPSGTDEIALASSTAEALGAGLGSTVLAAGPEGEATLRVVGIVALPGFDGDSLRSGWTADRAAMDALGWEPGCNNESECFTTTAVAFGGGADLDRGLAALRDAGYEVDAPEPSGEVVLLAEADQVPGLAAAGLGLVAVAGLVHTVSVTVARRRHELGVLRAIGLDRRRSAGVLVAEAFAVGLAGGAAGGVVGVVVGRQAWRAAARSIGIGPALPGTGPLAVTVVLGVVAVAVAAAVVPAVRAARVRPVAALRET